MGKYIHRFQTESDFDNAYNGSAYTEPWVSYTERIEPQYEVTSFTWSLESSYGEDMTGEFTYIGDYYVSTRDSETGEKVYDLTLAYQYRPIWSNGKTYVFPLDVNSKLTRNVNDATRLMSVNLVPGHSGFTDGDSQVVLGEYGEKAGKYVEPSQVAYNKADGAIYLTWDGTSMTKLREGTADEAEYPTLIVDQAKTYGDVKKARVYINNELYFTLEDFNNSYTVLDGRKYRDFIIFGRDTNGNTTCKYQDFVKLS